jgi:hypothetical protein
MQQKDARQSALVVHSHTQIFGSLKIVLRVILKSGGGNLSQRNQN